MPKHLPNNHGRLLVVSDTAMCSSPDGDFAFGPVVHELEYIADLFQTIRWIGYNQPSLVGNPIAKKIVSPIIGLLLLRAVGGNSLWQKILVLLRVPSMVLTIYKEVRAADVIHTRGPSVPALIALCISYFIRKKVWWHKYAGNWAEPNPPLAYRLQRWLLMRLSHTRVTINGSWPNQPVHVLSFENPCLYDRPNTVIAKPSLAEGYILCFVGALNDKKGIPQIISMLNHPELRNRIKACHIVGDGPQKKEYITRLINKEGIYFTGFLGKEEVNVIMRQSHFILLPSQSEGFPKVIAEAAALGTVPIVSNVSCIGQYITPDRGFLWDTDTDFNHLVKQAFGVGNQTYTSLSIEVSKMATEFTYSHFKSRLITQILTHAQ